jgi:DnaJ domain
MLDPKGYYALLGVRPDVPATAIHDAYRRKAKLLHPDVPVTGDLHAFLRIKEAYETLSDGLLRNAYDRSARPGPFPASMSAGRRSDFNSPRLWAGYDPPIDELEASLPPDPPTPEPFVMPVRPKVLAWGGVGLVVVAGVVGGIWGLTRTTPLPEYNVSAHPTPSFATEAPADPPGVATSPGPAMPYYVQPIVGSAMLWRYDDKERQYRPSAELKPFTSVLMLRLVSHGALAEVQLPGGQLGYIYPHLLAPGDAAAAQRAACIYQAGETPQNGEILSPPRDAPATPIRVGTGSGTTVIDNTGDSPAVVALRRGLDFVAVYVMPHAHARLTGLEAGEWQIDWASGDLWSRPCFQFMAGMRGRRLQDADVPPVITLPTDQGADIADHTFGR